MNVDNLIEQILANGLDKDPRIMALLNCVIRDPGDSAKLELLQKLAAPRLIMEKLFGKPFKEPDASVDGLIKFALTTEKIPVGVNLDEPHVLIGGQTGSGKTVLLIIMQAQAIIQGVTMWLFTKAQDTRKLLGVTREILISDFTGQVRFNPLLPPPGLSHVFWVNCCADIFTQAFSLYDGTKNFLIDTLEYLFSKNSMPTMNDLLQVVKAQHYPLMSRFARYQESAINRLSGMISSLGETLTYPFVKLEDLAMHHVIFEIDGLTAEQQIFTVNLLLTWLFYYKLRNHCENYHFVGIDDANLVFDKSYEYRPDHGKPIISHLLSTVRKSRISVIACTQIPHQMGASISSNSFTKIMFSLANADDVNSMARSMGISDREQLDYCHKLGKREVVVKFSGRYKEPFLANVPEVPNV